MTSTEDKDGSASLNFMRQFRDKNTRQLKNLTSIQFMEVWSHYDKDGESSLIAVIGLCSPKRNTSLAFE